MTTELEQKLQEEKDNTVALIRKSVSEVNQRHRTGIKYYRHRFVKVRNEDTRGTTLDIHTLMLVMKGRETTIPYEILAGFREKRVDNVLEIYVPVEPQVLKGHVSPSNIDIAIMELVDRHLIDLHYEKSQVGQSNLYKKVL